jgi:predicted deacylase
MPNVLKLGGVSAARGEVKYGPIASFDMRDGTPVGIPVIVVNGVKEGKTLLCIAGHHANETLGIEAVIQAARKLDPKIMSGAFGFHMGTRTNPLDEDWVWPHYPGNADGILSERIAKVIWDNAVILADVVIDLHSNFKPALNFVMVGRVPDEKVSAEALRLAKLTGVTTIQSGEEPKPKQPGQTSSITEMAMYEGKPSWYQEGNGSNTLEQEDVDIMVRAILNVCKGMGIIEGPTEAQEGIKIVKARPGMKLVPLPSLMVRANRGGIVIKAIGPGEFVKKGGAIARIHNLYGEEVEVVRAPVDGYTWGFPLRTKSALQTQAVFSGAEVCYWFHEVPE